jgi:hypothetical protein
VLGAATVLMRAMVLEMMIFVGATVLKAIVLVGATLLESKPRVCG